VRNSLIDTRSSESLSRLALLDHHPMRSSMARTTRKTIVLGDGRARGRLVEVASHADELTLPFDPSDRFGACVTYRPSGRRDDLGYEVWCEHTEPDWADTAPAVKL